MTLARQRTRALSAPSLADVLLAAVLAAAGGTATDASAKGFKMKMGGAAEAAGGGELWPGAGKECKEGYEHALVDVKPLGTLGGRSVVRERIRYLGDLDGDGDVDVLTESGRDNGETLVGWHKNDGKGGFTYIRLSGGGFRKATQAAVADFDGDGDLDVAHGNADAGNGWPGGLSLLENGGKSGVFKEHAFFTGEDATVTLAGDFDGDGSADIAYRNNDGRFVYLANTAKNATEWSDPRTMGTEWDKLTPFHVLDVDGDGDADALFQRKLDGYEVEVGWLENQLKGRKWQKHVINANAALESITLLDYDRDGDLDLMGGYIRGLTVLQNMDGKGTWAPTELLLRKAYTQTDYATLVQLDGDPDLELIVGGSGGFEGLQVFDYDAANKACRRAEAFKGRFPATHTLATADLDGDGDEDVLAGARSRPLVWIENAFK